MIELFLCNSVEIIYYIRFKTVKTTKNKYTRSRCIFESTAGGGGKCGSDITPNPHATEGVERRRVRVIFALNTIKILLYVRCTDQRY